MNEMDLFGAHKLQELFESNGLGHQCYIEKGKHLHFEGKGRLYIINAGVLSVLVGEEEDIYTFYTAGDIIGIENIIVGENNVFNLYYEAIIMCKLYCIEEEDFRSIFYYPENLPFYYVLMNRFYQHALMKTLIVQEETNKKLIKFYKTFLHQFLLDGSSDLENGKIILPSYLPTSKIISYMNLSSASYYKQLHKLFDEGVLVSSVLGIILDIEKLSSI